jgi:hypothetical protein
VSPPANPLALPLDRTPQYRQGTPQLQRALMDALRATQRAPTCQCVGSIDGGERRCAKCGRRMTNDDDQTARRRP